MLTTMPDPRFRVPPVLTLIKSALDGICRVMLRMEPEFNVRFGKERVPMVVRVAGSIVMAAPVATLVVREVVPLPVTMAPLLRRTELLTVTVLTRYVPPLLIVIELA